MPAERPTQAPSRIDRRGRDARRTRERFIRLLAAWAALAAGLFVLRGLLDDPFWRELFLPMAFGAVVLAGVLTVRAARVRGGASGDGRRRKERRVRDRRGSRE